MCWELNIMFSVSNLILLLTLFEYLSDQIERIPKRALRVICPDLSYSEAIEELDMETLKTRRKGLCTKVFKSIVNDKHHKIHHLVPTKHLKYLQLKKSKLFQYSKM